MTSKTIGGSLAHGVTLTAATYNYNPLYVTGTINAAAGDGVDGDNTQSWTVANTGTIEAAAGNGVKLLDGGTVTNGASGAASGLISGYNDGIYIHATLGTVTNFGTVTAGANAIGVFLDSGGIVTNGTPGATTARIASAYIGVDIENVPGAVENFGTIVGTAPFGAVRLDGGVLVNGGSGSAGATIDGDTGVAVYNAGASLTLTNFGLITVTGSNGRPAVRLATIGTSANLISNFGTIAGNLATGIYQQKGGVITNGDSGASTALIAGGPFGIDITGGAATVTNFGTIDGTGALADAIYLAQGGTVINSGTIAGAVHGVDIAHTSGLVTNLGTIEGTSPSTPQVTGVALYGGSITNGAGTATAAVIYGVQYGAIVGNAAGTVLNFGSIAATGTSGIGLRLVAGGTIDNPGTITGPSTGVFLDSPTSLTNGKSGTASGYITGQTGVNMQTPGTVINYGRIIGAGPSSATGVYLTSGGTVRNFGTIAAGGTAGTGIDFAFLNAGAIIVNGKSGSAAGLISGVGIGVSVEISGGTVTNFATITGGTDGVDLSGTVAVVLNNSGTIDGGNRGAYLGGTAGATVVNSGTINGGAEGVDTRDAPAIVINSGTGIIEGNTGNALNLTDGGTVTDSGTISSASGGAISFGGTGANRLVLDPGYRLGGEVVGSTSTGATNTLELGSAASAGTVTTVLATEFVNFGTLTVDAGARWTLTGSSSLSGITLTDLGTLTNTGTLTGAGSLVVDPASLFNSGYIGLTVTLSGGGYLDNEIGGTISGAGLDAGVYLGKGGSVVNGGLIEGSYNGVEVRRSAGTVTNSGTILGNDLGGVGLYAGGTVINDSGGLISGALGLAIRYGSGAVINSGTIKGSTVAAGIWISQSGGTVTNNSGGLISGRDGVEIVNGATGTVINSGTIAGGVHAVSVAGVYMTQGGSVINDAGGVITGEYGVFIAAHGMVVNGGTIVGSGGIAGVDINAGGSVTNNSGGLITGASADGIDITTNAGTVINAGTITATGAGIVLSASGTVIDSGTISGGGGTAVSFGGTGANRLVLDPGDHLGGKVVGSTSAGATNTLELGSAASIGTVSGLGSSFVNFGRVTVDAGARWVLSGSNTIGAGATLNNIGALTDRGTVVDAGTIIGNSRLTVVSGGSVRVVSGGTTRGTALSGGVEIVSAGGTASGGTVASGGIERLYGRASGGAVTSGGQQIVEKGGVASGVTLNHGGSQTVFSGGTTRRTVLSGGIETVHGTASGTTVDGGGVATVYGKASGGTIHGGLIEVASGGTASGTTSFATGGTLQLDAGASFAGKVKGFAVPDRIDLRGVAFGAGTIRKFTEAASHTSGTLTVTDGTRTVHLTLLGNYKTSNFTLSTDNHGGTRVTDPPIAGGSPQTTFADIAPARPHAGAAGPGNPPGYLRGDLAVNERPYAGQTLLATGPPGEHDGVHNPLLRALR